MSHKKIDKYKKEHGEWYYSASLGVLKLNHWPVSQPSRLRPSIPALD